MRHNETFCHEKVVAGAEPKRCPGSWGRFPTCHTPRYGTLENLPHGLCPSHRECLILDRGRRKLLWRFHDVMLVAGDEPREFANVDVLVDEVYRSVAEQEISAGGVEGIGLAASQ